MVAVHERVLGGVVMGEDARANQVHRVDAFDQPHGQAVGNHALDLLGSPLDAVGIRVGEQGRAA